MTSCLRRDIFRAVLRRARGVVLLRFFQNVVVRRWFVFVIVRFAIVFAHREIGEFIPHQDATQIGMAVEVDAVQIVDLAFLKFRAAPDRSE